MVTSSALERIQRQIRSGAFHLRKHIFHIAATVRTQNAHATTATARYAIFGYPATVRCTEFLVVEKFHHVETEEENLFTLGQTICEKKKLFKIKTSQSDPAWHYFTWQIVPEQIPIVGQCEVEHLIGIERLVYRSIRP